MPLTKSSTYSEREIFNQAFNETTNRLEMTSAARGGTPTHTFISVGTASTAVLSANAARSYLQLINDSANTIYVSFSGAAALNRGTRINANGGSVIFDQYVPTGAIAAISGTAASGLLVTEGT